MQAAVPFRGILFKTKVFENTDVFTTALVLVFVAKAILLGLFSSGYQSQLFLPFIETFFKTGSDPWQYFWQNPAEAEFPYQPLMLYIYTGAYSLNNLFQVQSAFFTNLLFKLPTLIADLWVTHLFLRIYPKKKWEVLFFYALSPIILYACYVHSQLDLIPTALLFTAVYYIRKAKWYRASAFFGLALSTKLSVLAALPLIGIYLWRNAKTQIPSFLAISLVIYGAFVAPYVTSEGFFFLSLFNSKQTGILESFHSLGDARIYLPLFVLFIALGRFALYERINKDLLDAFLTLIFSIFVFLILPSPGWYVWMVPFLCLLFIKLVNTQPVLIRSYIALNVAYLAYFVFCYPSSYVDYAILGNPLSFKTDSTVIQNGVFTLLEAILFLCIMFCYRIGVKSNNIYKRSSPLVIGIGGDSGAGKSTILADIKSILDTRLLEIEGDGDHKWERGNENWQHFTHLNPKANYLHRQTEAILALKKGMYTQRSDYDHTNGTFTAPKKIKPKDFIVLCGLHPFYLPKMRKLVDIKIYMDPDTSLKLNWKVRRDTKKRGYTVDQVKAQITARATDVEKYIQPQKDFADLVISYFPLTLIPQTDEALTDTLGDEQIGIKLTVDSSVPLEEIVEILVYHGIKVEWDYDEDLKSQYIKLFQPVPAKILRAVSHELLQEFEDYVQGEFQWAEGYRGFVQLLVLLLISERLKEKEPNASHV